MFCIEKHNKQVENTKHKNMTSIVLDRMLQYVSFHFEILFYTAAQFESGSLSLSEYRACRFISTITCERSDSKHPSPLVITHTNTHTLTHTHTNTLLIHRWKVKKYTHTWSYTVRELTKSSLSLCPSLSLSFLFSRS